MAKKTIEANVQEIDGKNVKKESKIEKAKTSVKQFFEDERTKKTIGYVKSFLIGAAVGAVAGEAVYLIKKALDDDSDDTYVEDGCTCIDVDDGTIMFIPEE